MPLPIYDRSIFKTYFEFNDTQLETWVDNVLKKLRAKGIVANYIERDTDESDADFDGLYEPIIKFFGYLVRLAREFELFKENDFLANAYLENKGVFTCGDESLDELAYSITNLLRRRSQRGTIKSIQGAESISEADGEVLSLLCWDEMTIFILGVARPQFNGFNINNSSPLYRGCTGRYDLNQAYEFTEDVEDLSKYPLINSSFINIETYNGKQCLHIESVPLGLNSGVGANDASKRIIINPNQNYEITFSVAQDITQENITFGCLCFDFAGNQINLLDVRNGTESNYFFQTIRLNKADRFYFVRGVIYNKDQESISSDNARLNIGIGRNLKFPIEAVSIIPYIIFDNDISDDSDSESDYFDSESIDFDIDSDGSGSDSDYDLQPSIYIWNLKVTPASLDYERCYINNSKFIDIICSNKNGKYSVNQIKDNLRKYFIPYNSAFNLTNLPRVIESEADISYLLLEDGTFLLLDNGEQVLTEDQNPD